MLDGFKIAVLSAAVVQQSMASSGVMSSNAVPGSSASQNAHFGPSRWHFTDDQIQNTPSRRDGIPWDRELSYRQQSAKAIQDMGRRLDV